MRSYPQGCPQDVYDSRRVGDESRGQGAGFPRFHANPQGSRRESAADCQHSSTVWTRPVVRWKLLVLIHSDGRPASRAQVIQILGPIYPRVIHNHVDSEIPLVTMRSEIRSDIVTCALGGREATSGDVHRVASLGSLRFLPHSG